MAQFFSGASGLAEAINAATQYDVSISVAQDIIRNAYLSAGTAGVRQVAADYGITAFGTQEAIANSVPLYWQVGAVESVTPTAAETLYPAVLDTTIDTVNNEVVFETAKQVTTQGGSKIFSAGAVKTATTALSVVGAVATGAQLGWESYKDHPDFWTELSESIFNTYQSPDGPVEVLARAHAGGYTTAVKEREVCKILQGLAQNGCFDSYTYESNIPESFPGGRMDVTWDEVQPLGTYSGLAFNKAKELYPNGTVIRAQADVYNENTNKWQGLVRIATSLPSNAYVAPVQVTPEETVFFAQGISNVYSITCTYDVATETVTYSTSGPSSNASIPSGMYSDSNGITEVGGLCVDITHIVADNELFTNDHSPSNLMLSPTASISDIAETLKKKYPQWFDDSWLQPEYDPETDSVNNERYYPITIPWWDPTIDTTKDPDFTPEAARDGDVKQDPDPKAQPQGDTATKNNPGYETNPALKPTVPVPPPTDTPSDPGAGAGGSASGLWAVYNPTIAELNDLGAYLWTNNIVELLQKFLQNPMDAIISLHRLYATPTTGSPQHIILGYLDSGVSANVVTNQFTTINCGSVAVSEFFEDARDYDAPYTVVEAYLPFIGIVRLRTEDIIGGTVNIVYEVDVYSGACLCKVFVTKLGAKQLLYTYSGNCSMQIPLTGGDRTRLLSGALTGAVAGAAMGGPVGAVAGAVGGAFKGGASIDRCGGFSANAACMGIKKPYIIITRKYAYDAGNYNQFYGFPSNVTVTLGVCHGYTQVKSVHIDSIPVATDTEKSEIETLLKQGVVIK